MLSRAAKPYAVHGKTKVYVLEESVSFYCIIFSQSPRTPVIKDKCRMSADVLGSLPLLVVVNTFS